MLEANRKFTSFLLWRVSEIWFGLTFFPQEDEMSLLPG